VAVLASVCGVPAASAAPAPPLNSAIDAPLFYQLLIGELELRSGEPGNAYQVILDAARRTREEVLFRRAVDIALQARAGDQALAATRDWRNALPESLDAVRTQVQILVALNRLGDTVEPLRRLIALTPEADRPGLIAALPRFLQRAPDRRQAAAVVEEVLQPMRGSGAAGVAAQVAIGRAWLAAGEADRALALAEAAYAEDPKAPGPMLLALELLQTRPQAEHLVLGYLKQPGAEPALRLAYVGALTSAQRLVDAAAQLEIATREQPTLAAPYLTLGAVRLELRQPQEAEVALLRYVELVQAQARAQAPLPGPAAAPASAAAAASAAPAAAAPAAAAPAAAAAAAAASEDDDEDETRTAQNLVRAWLLLARAAEMRNDDAAAEAWLARIDEPQRTLEVQQRRAALLVRQGKVAEARALVREVPEQAPGDARAKLSAEAQVLRDAKLWSQSYEVLADATRRFPDDVELLYEQAMIAEKLDRLGDMERLLRRVIELRPEHPHAHNALGYSLADRNLRLPEARQLIVRALELQPGDPFITDSLGWVEFRLGNREEALRLLRQAYNARPDTEIGAHLGEVLWSLDQRDEARRIWGEAKRRDSANEVLRGTLERLGVDL
jgi:tetratricopeptide (TPR) repeat protein